MDVLVFFFVCVWGGGVRVGSVCVRCVWMSCVLFCVPARASCRRATSFLCVVFLLVLFVWLVGSFVWCVLGCIWVYVCVGVWMYVCVRVRVVRRRRIDGDQPSQQQQQQQQQKPRTRLHAHLEGTAEVAGGADRQTHTRAHTLHVYSIHKWPKCIHNDRHRTSHPGGSSSSSSRRPAHENSVHTPQRRTRSSGRRTLGPRRRGRRLKILSLLFCLVFCFFWGGG
jgi:Ca2+/Na+ antiporter